MKKRIAWVAGVVAVFLCASVVTAFSTQKEVVFAFNDGSEPVSVKVWGGTLAEAAQKAGLHPAEIAEKYESDLSWSAMIEQSVEVNLKRLYQVKVTDAKTSREYTTVQTTVQAFLDEQEIELGENDHINITPESAISDALHLVIDRVKVEKEERKEKVAFETVRQKDADLLKGKEVVTQEGKDGYRLIEVTTTYKNDQVVKTEEKVVEEIKPQQKMIRVGIKVEPRPVRTATVSRASSTSRSSSRSTAAEVNESAGTINGMPYFKSLRVKATAYTHTGSRTATGVMPSRGTVAVDPRVIPLGTRLFIPGYGVGVAQDTGGAVGGHRIDLFYESASQANAWGIRNVTVYLLK